MLFTSVSSLCRHSPDNAHETDSDPPMARIGHGLLAPHGSKDLGEHLEAKRSGDLPSEPPVIHTGDKTGWHPAGARRTSRGRDVESYISASEDDSRH